MLPTLGGEIGSVMVVSRRIRAGQADRLAGGGVTDQAFAWIQVPLGQDGHFAVAETASGGGTNRDVAELGRLLIEVQPALGALRQVPAMPLTGQPDPEFDPHLFRLSRYDEGDPVSGQYEYSIVG